MSDNASSTPAPTATGKGRPTPSRAEQEAARKRPLIANTKEARAQAKADMAKARERARIGMANGEEKFLPIRDKGPQKKFVRDYVDARLFLSEWVMGLMVVVILLSMIPIEAVAYWSFVALWIYIALAVLELVLLSRRVKNRVADHFGGKDRLEKGIGWYAVMRALQLRFMRMPKPQTQRGAHRR